MAGRKQPPKTIAGAAPEGRAPIPTEPPHPTYTPAWCKDRGLHDCQYVSLTIHRVVRELAAGKYRLPRFQRPWRWSDEQVGRLFDSLVQGYHVGSLLLWERRGLPAYTESLGGVAIESPAGGPDQWGHELVIDGQQRLGSIAAAALSGRFFFDLERGVLRVVDGPYRIPVGILLGNRTRRLLDWYPAHAAEHGIDALRLFDACCAAQSVFDHVYLSTVRLPHDWSIDRVIESYRRLATEGTPISPEDLRDGLARAEGGFL